MGARSIQTIFLAVGLAMVWLGLFYTYELNARQQGQEGEGNFFEQETGFQVYTLSNKSYGEDSTQTMKLNELEGADLSVSSAEETFISEPGLFQDKELLGEKIEEENKAGAVEEAPASFPFMLAFGGLLLFCCGLVSVKLSGF